jgi:pyruvate,water dikinase
MDREFMAPGPGSWILENAHQSGAVTPYTASCYSYGLPLGFREGCARYGLPLSHLQTGFVHGFMYVQRVPLIGKPDAKSLPPKWLFSLAGLLHPELRRRTKQAQSSISNRLWLSELAEWDELKKDSVKRNSTLQSVELEELDKTELLDHLENCFGNAREMVYRHHTYTVSALMPIGRFLDIATRHSGKEVAQIMPVLAGSSPVSTGIAKEELAILAEELRECNISKNDLTSLPPTEALALIRNCCAKAGEALDAYLSIAGHMLVGGFCVSEKTLLESPNIILARIVDALEPKNENPAGAELENSIRDCIKSDFRDEFEQSLSDARITSRLRDERGVYNDIWAAGISRMAILEAGQRLCEEGVLSNAELILDASHEEMLALLDGDRSLSEKELEERRSWRWNRSNDNVPDFLGGAPLPPPPVDWFPKSAQPTMQAFSIAMDGLFNNAQDEAEAETIPGLPVSPGVYEGTAKVIIGTREFDRLQEGDILVTVNTSAGFNVVLPIIGALVTDRGGVLSHAAIVSREYGIPGVVGTKTASKSIKDGDRIRVDGDKGEVTILS